MRLFLACLLITSIVVPTIGALSTPASAQTIEDSDLDTVPDESDNCPDVGNTDQTDTDGDETGDACDERPREIVSAGPLTPIYVSEDLNCAVEYPEGTDTASAFYQSTACGTFLAANGFLYGPANVPDGPDTDIPWQPESQSGPSGAGTEEDPLVVETIVSAPLFDGPPTSTGYGEIGTPTAIGTINVVQTDSYVEGEDHYDTEIDVSVDAPDSDPVDAILYRAGDCFRAELAFGGLLDDSVNCREAVEPLGDDSNEYAPPVLIDYDASGASGLVYVFDKSIDCEQLIPTSSATLFGFYPESGEAQLGDEVTDCDDNEVEVDFGLAATDVDDAERPFITDDETYWGGQGAICSGGVSLSACAHHQALDEATDRPDLIDADRVDDSEWVFGFDDDLEQTTGTATAASPSASDFFVYEEDGTEHGANACFEESDSEVFCTFPTVDDVEDVPLAAVVHCAVTGDPSGECSTVGSIFDSEAELVPGNLIQEFDPDGGPSGRRVQANWDDVWDYLEDQEPFDDTCECARPTDAGLGLSWEINLGGSVGGGGGGGGGVTATASDDSVVRSHATRITARAPQQGEMPDDFDHDGHPDGSDNCPDDYNPDQEDGDNDGDGDACDPLPDDDEDGVSNDDDNCPQDFNPADEEGDQSDQDDDGIGDACDNSDADSWLDDEDNCPNDTNESQSDPDEDGLGVPCDPDEGNFEDEDSDGVGDSTDTCPDDWNPGDGQQADKDGDGTPDACDPADDLCPTALVANAGPMNTGFEDGLDHWTQGLTTEGIAAVGQDSFGGVTVTPNDGAGMARLGAVHHSSDEPQEIGPNALCQRFVIPEGTDPDDLVLNFAFNVFTYDYTGYDSLRFEASIPGDNEIVASVNSQAWGSGIDLKSTGWQNLTIEFDDSDRGKEALLLFTAGGTTDTLFGTWAYIDSSTGPVPPVAPVEDVDSETGSVSTNPLTGDLVIQMPYSEPSDLTFEFGADCPDGTTLVGTPEVVLFHGGLQDSYPSTALGGGLFSATIPEEDIASGDIVVFIECDGPDGTSTSSDTIASIVLYDPSGDITDAETDAAIEGATVTLFKMPDSWGPEQTADSDPTTCQSNLTKPENEAWSQQLTAQQLALAEEANPFSGLIDPQVNPQQTNVNGRYGWNVAEGCWFVTVEKEGYEDLTSPVVGVPPEVTDLDLELVPIDDGDPDPDPGGNSGGGGGSRPSPTPSPSVSPTPSPAPTGIPAPQVPGVAGCDAAAGDICGTDGDDTLKIDAASDVDGDGVVEVFTGKGDDHICVVAGSGIRVIVRAGGGDDRVTVGDCDDEQTRAGSAVLSLMGVEARAAKGATVLHAFGGAGKDVLHGGSGNDLLRGGKDADRLVGSGGKDVLRGDAGTDVLKGLAGADKLQGGAGRDKLYGGAGRDVLRGSRKDRCAQSGVRVKRC